MRQKLIYLFILVIITITAVVFKILVLDSDSRTVGYIQVFSTPDATVFVNARAVGKTPYTQSMPPGEYNIKLIPIVDENIPTQATVVSWEGKVQVSSYQYTYIRRELKNTEVESTGEVLTIRKSANVLGVNEGEIVVETEPEGAIVSFNGRDMGVSPYLVKNVPVGLHEISVYLSRFKRRTIQLKVLPGGYATVAHFQLGLDIDFDKKFEFARAFEASGSATLPNVPTSPPSPTPTPAVEKVEIEDTPTGFLRVRTEGSLNGREISQARPGEIYPYLGEANGWVNIKLSDGNEGWVKAEYVKKIYKSN